MKSLIITFVFISLGVQAAQQEYGHFKANKQLQKFVIYNHSGNIKIDVSKRNNVEIYSDQKDFDKSCELKETRYRHHIKVEVIKSGWGDIGECRVDFAIALPKTVALVVWSGKGKVEINGFKSRRVNYPH